ncbi:hypothetical protein ASPNIDRAFT_38676 [Aspergillus niger ATCC 1015]|uniref:Uncharacterized protein n=1 Tax=Aspergillus niger (strain ATCC 1015 / CBS 113.46 / FGSC A1144 / LSHB Ac4 / NCTC 3858a / NRRL 328 / USDA 3528.7) TaxID=380704 RepID=G3YF81_ASPNA|nr:uncharacterized protein BO96DRAFT_337906 [Aspergillus niger CBS 101883]EHA17711.1 hypothetical protein ASPNIDRAFT_38676 [Aspergillus niger ATCC 1015]PYH56409.1 hypothetical protein BO96DRAFT_337906 [Aspergillus niger CBS 101883]
MANNWREKAALVSDRAIVLSTRRSLRPTRNLFRRRRAALPSRVEQTAVQKPPNQGESIPPPKSGVSPERAIAPTHASFNFTSNQPEAACRGCGSQPVASRRSWPIARQLQSCRVLSSQLAAASFCQDVRHPMNDSNSTVHPSH